MDWHVFIKLLLVNILVFVLLIFGFYIVPDTNTVLDVGVGFYSMEVGVLLGAKAWEWKDKKDD